MKRGRAWQGSSLSKDFPPFLFCRDRELGFLSTAVIWEEAASPPKPDWFLRSISQPAANPSDSERALLSAEKEAGTAGTEIQAP